MWPPCQLWLSLIPEGSAPAFNDFDISVLHARYKRLDPQPVKTFRKHSPLLFAFKFGLQSYSRREVTHPGFRGRLPNPQLLLIAFCEN